MSEEVRAALERTVRRGSARIEFRFQISLDDILADESQSMGSQGGSAQRRLTRWAWHVAGRMFISGMRRLIKRLSRTMAEGVVGIIDFEANRCVYCLDRSKVEMIIGDRRWYGAPGTTVERLSAGPASELQPLWLVDLVRGVVDARVEGTERLDGRMARRFSARADLNRAAEVVSYEMAVPSNTAQLVDLTNIAVEVWVDDDGYIRRIRYASGHPGTPMSTSTLDLTEFGIALPSDWSRIPTVATDHPPTRRELSMAPNRAGARRAGKTR